MSTKKRFYIAPDICHEYLRDNSKPETKYVASTQLCSSENLQEYCDLLNKGHEAAKNREALRKRIADMVESEREVLDLLAEKDGPESDQ